MGSLVVRTGAHQGRSSRPRPLLWLWSRWSRPQSMRSTALLKRASLTRLGVARTRRGRLGARGAVAARLSPGSAGPGVPLSPARQGGEAGDKEPPADFPGVLVSIRPSSAGGSSVSLISPGLKWPHLIGGLDVLRRTDLAPSVRSKDVVVVREFGAAAPRAQLFERGSDGTFGSRGRDPQVGGRRRVHPPLGQVLDLAPLTRQGGCGTVSAGIDTALAVWDRARAAEDLP
jgi:hypothetical protein